MSRLLLDKRQHGHGIPTHETPTGYWKPGKPAPYGNLDIPQCEGEENCDYWENYYTQHNRHILLMFITWGLIAFMLFVAATINTIRRRAYKARLQKTVGEGALKPAESSTRGKPLFGSLATICRHYLLPQSVFGLLPSVTRLQALLFILLLVYAILFSFVGIAYKEWVNPTNPPGRRVGVLEFAGDRTGCLAFAFIPLVFVLGSRDNVFSLLTGISYQHFNFLHRWVGRWIFIFTVIHTVFWTIELGVMYQPQPERYQNTWKKRYWKYGVGATSFATYLFLHSLRSVRRLTGYEFFRKTHELIAVLFLGACWGHWPQMREWMIAGIAIVFFDRIIRYLRIFFIHMNWTSSEKGSFGLHAFEGTIVRHHDPEDNVDVLILRLSKATVKYEVGQHFFLTFPTLSLFESHPFTPSNYASKKSDNGLHEQIYVIRVLSGQTHRLAKVCREPKVEYTIPTVCAGPYGATDVLDNGAENIQLVAGGTGVSFTLPFAMKLVADAKNKTAVRAAAKRIDFVWIVRRDANVDWIREYLISLQKEAKSSGLELFVRIFVTRGNISHSKKGIDSSNSGSLTSPIPSSSSSIGEKDFITKVYPGDMTAAGAAGKELSVTTKPEVVSNEKANASVALAYNAESWAQTECRPQIAYIVRWFWEEKCASGRVQVLGSGPAGMGSDLRNAVAACNVPEMVRRGEERGAVGCWWDAREY